MNGGGDPTSCIPSSGGVDDEDLLRMVWYRMSKAGAMVEIPCVTGGFYQPSVDDVGARVLCRCQDSLREEYTCFGEVGPLTMGTSRSARRCG